MKPEIAAFSQPFLSRGLRAPRRKLERREAGEVLSKGWSIQFLFGEDERGPYMDYYASHRMADDAHWRVRPGVLDEDLPTIITGYFGSDDPEEHRKLTEEYFKKNQEIAELLIRKGFMSPTVSVSPSTSGKRRPHADARTEGRQDSKAPHSSEESR